MGLAAEGYIEKPQIPQVATDAQKLINDSGRIDNNIALIRDVDTAIDFFWTLNQDTDFPHPGANFKTWNTFTSTKKKYCYIRGIHVTARALNTVTSTYVSFYFQNATPYSTRRFYFKVVPSVAAAYDWLILFDKPLKHASDTDLGISTDGNLTDFDCSIWGYYGD